MVDKVIVEQDLEMDQMIILKLYFLESQTMNKKGCTLKRYYLITAQSWHTPGTLNIKVYFNSYFAKIINVDFIE